MLFNMKFFKCHSKKLLENKVLIVHDKFTDIGPDVFQGCTSEAVKLGSQTRVIRNYAFSGIKNCSVLLPETIEEIESLAFDGLGSDVIFFCKENSYAHNYCTQYGLNVSFDCDKINIMAEEFCNEEKNKAVVSESVVIHEPVINKEEKFVVSESTENNVKLAFSPLKTDDKIFEQQ